MTNVGALIVSSRGINATKNTPSCERLTVKFTKWSRDISTNLGMNERGMRTHLEHSSCSNVRVIIGRKISS